MAGISDLLLAQEVWRALQLQLSEKKAPCKENERVKKSVADLQLDKLIPKESLNHLRPKA